MTSQRSVVFAEPVRTAIGTFGGSLKDIPAPDLGAAVIRSAIERAGLKPDEIATAVMGNVVQAGVKMNPARQAAIRSGLPVSVPAMTVNRVCGSGAQAIVSAAQEILLGSLDVAVAGGMENMDLAPYLIDRGRWGYRMGDGHLYDSMLRDGLNDAFSDAASGWHTEDLVRDFQVTREAQDQWAVRSQQRFGAAQTAGKFKTEIVAIDVPDRKSRRTAFEQDEHIRPDTTLEALGKLKPAFRKDGTITAGNAPGLNSGAAAMVVADADWAEKRSLVPAARLVAYGIAAVEPGMFGLGPIPAVKQALGRAGWNAGDVERIEINEAFAAIVLAVARELAQATPTDELQAQTVQAFTRRKPARRPLPEHLPRERVVYPMPAACPCCGGVLHKLGEDVTETLELVPRQWKVIQHVREKHSCRSCEKITQPPAPSHPIARGRAGPGLLAHGRWPTGWALRRPL